MRGLLSFGLVSVAVAWVVGCSPSSPSDGNGACSGQPPISCPAGDDISCVDAVQICQRPTDAGAVDSGHSPTSDSGEGGSTVQLPEAGSTKEAGATTEGGTNPTTEAGGTTEAGTSSGSVLCTPCTSDSDCGSSGVCIYWGENNAYFCAPLCIATMCPTNLSCGGTGEDIDMKNTYNVCYPASNICP